MPWKLGIFYVFTSPKNVFVLCVYMWFKQKKFFLNKIKKVNGLFKLAISSSSDTIYDTFLITNINYPLKNLLNLRCKMASSKNDRKGSLLFLRDV